MILREKVFFLFSTAAKNGQLGDQCFWGKIEIKKLSKRRTSEKLIIHKMASFKSEVRKLLMACLKALTVTVIRHL
jgi:hypothetical protein